MLASCLVLGCAASSFLCRRAGRDPVQPLVVGILVAAAALWGTWTGETAETVLLTHVSWALCAAMPTSFVVERVVFGPDGTRKRREQSGGMPDKVAAAAYEELVVG